MILPDFKHPQETERMAAISDNAVLTGILDLFHTAYANVTAFAHVIDRNYPVTEKTNPRVYRLYQSVKEKFGIWYDIPLYADFNYPLTAETAGTDGDCAIIINSSCFEYFSDEELLAVFGREIGHIYYEHVKYINIAKVFDELSEKIPGVIGAAALPVAKSILIEWTRCAEYTADRAAAIACGDVDAALRVLVKSMGGYSESHNIEFDHEKIIGSIDDYIAEDRISKIGQIAFQSLMNTMPVPFGRIRMKELYEWAKSDSCRSQFPHLYYGNTGLFGLRNYTDGDTVFAQGRKMMANNAERGLALIHAAAKIGNPSAMDLLGTSYLLGKTSLKQNIPLGLEYLQKAVTVRCPDACFHLGGCYVIGAPDAVPKDEDAGYRLIRYAAGKNCTEAQTYFSKQSYQAPVIPEAMMRNALKDFQQKHPAQKCVLSPLTSAKDGGNSSLIDELMIPADEVVYAIEESSFCGTFATAICGGGIYVSGKNELPEYFSWNTFKSALLTGKKRFGSFELWLDNRFVFRCCEKNAADSIAGLLVMLKKQLEVM